MGWEVRNGRRYLYRNRRVNGRPVREYLAADDQFGFGELMASELERLQDREADVRRLQREARIAFHQRIDGLLAATNTANVTLRLAAEGLIASVGFHKHKRGEWRMRRDLAQLKDT